LVRLNISRWNADPKFQLSPGEKQELLADYLPYCATVRMPTKLPATPRCGDPDDLPFLHLAVVGKADALVSGDKDLLDLDGQFICPILTTGAWLSMAG
jgi:predicted nucleic acid-binding protein